MLLEQMNKDQLLDLCKRWEQAHCQTGVNLIGSEFYADPGRVFEEVKLWRAELLDMKRAKEFARREAEAYKWRQAETSVAEAEEQERHWDHSAAEHRCR